MAAAAGGAAALTAGSRGGTELGRGAGMAGGGLRGQDRAAPVWIWDGVLGYALNAVAMVAFLAALWPQLPAGMREHQWLQSMAFGGDW